MTINYKVVSNKHNITIESKSYFNDYKNAETTLRDFYTYELDTPVNELEITILQATYL